MTDNSQQHIVGAILVALFMVAVSVFSGFSLLESAVADKPEYHTQAETSQFLYYKNITLNSTQIPSAQTDFPILVYLASDADLATDALDSGYDIAFFNATGSQLNHEIELFNGTTGKLVAWVNVTSLVHDSDTNISMYYGDADIGSSAENKHGTWDSNYVLVMHMNGSSVSNIIDSTTNANDGATELNTPVYEQTGKAGYGVTFDGTDSIRVTDSASLDVTSDLTIEAWAYPTSQTRFYACSKWNDAGDQRSYALATDSSYKTRFRACSDGSDATDVDATSTGTFTANCWVYLTGVFDDSGNKIYAYHNATTNAGSAYANSLYSGSADVSFSGYITTGDAGGQMLTCTLDECRISKTKRSDDWILTTYNCIINSSDNGFFSIGAEQGGGGGGGSSSYSLNGLPDSKITWAGIAGNSVLCNETGDTNEWLEINMSINASQNVTGIRIFMDDLNDTDAWINASNITLYVSKDNSSYASMGAFIDGGSNITINASTWPGGAGTNPFTDGAGLTDKNTSIWCVFKLNIPAGLSTDIFYSSASDSCKVYIGHYT